MQSYLVNRHGSLILPANLFAQLDFSVITSLAQFEAIVKRDIESKARSGTEILESIEADKYRSRIELLRDVALNLYWVNRNTLTLYHKRPMRWRDVPRNREDLFLPVQAPWQDADRKIASMKAAFERLPSSDPQAAAAEAAIFEILFDVVRYKRHHATYMPPIKPTIAEFLADPEHLTTVLDRHDPDFRCSPKRTSSTSGKTCPSSRRSTAGSCCCTISIRGTARASAWPGRTRSATTIS